MNKFDLAVRSIFQLRSSLELVFFKDFIQEYEMPEGVNQTQMKTLLMLNFIGNSPMSEVSQMLNLEKGSFTPVANRLIKMGYITKEQSHMDRRIYHLSLTKEGQTLARAFGHEHMLYMKGRLNELNTDQVDSFLNNVQEITETLSTLSGVDLSDCAPKTDV